MSEMFDSFNAPQFFDFTRDSDCTSDNADEFFDFTVAGDPLSIEVPKVNENHGNRYSFRRSMSCGDIAYIQQALDRNQKTTEHGNPEGGQACEHNDLQEQLSEVTSTTSTNEQQPLDNLISHKKTSPQKHLNRLARPKQHVSDENIHKKFIPMAEAVRRFQYSTPERFRARQKSSEQHVGLKREVTKPISPHFKTNARQRQHELLTTEEKEWHEFQDQQRFKIKAHPVNKKILQGPVIPIVPVDKKQPTVPEPFKLTTIQHKVPLPPKKTINEFHANPIPKAVLKPLQSKFPLLKPPKQPPIVNKMTLGRTSQKPQTVIAPPLTRTRPLPFSFELRDRMMREKKERLIKRVFDEEKKAREFHAKPIPEGVLKAPKIEGLSRTKSQQSVSNQTSNEHKPSQFKARPASVLHKKPFVPVKKERPLEEICNLKLNTDIRAAKRDAFEKALKEKEAAKALAKQLEETKLKELEDDHIKSLRKMTEYKAQPVKKYKEVHIQPSGKVTIPVTPHFHVDRLKKNRENKENDTD